MKIFAKNPNIYKAFFLTIFLAAPMCSQAFSVSGFLELLQGATVTSKNTQNPKRQESLQNLKVLEPNKFLTSTSELEDIAKNVVEEEDTSFEVKKEFQDALGDIGSEGAGENAVYTVQKGDSIYSIASYFGVSVNTIMTYNHMDSRTVHVGDVLEVPSVSGVMYTVKKGDTLAAVSKKYSVDMEDVKLYNGLLTSDDLSIGDEVFLPGAKDLAIATPGKSPKNTKAKNILASSKKGTQWANGDTSHLNTTSDIKKYSSLPKFAGYYIFPAPGSVRTQKMHGHNGVDLAAPRGTPILASAEGVVKVAKSSGYNFGYGNYIIVSHPNGSETIYAHLSRVDVAVGQSVARGQQIAAMGSSGNSTGSHLHFEIRGAYNPFAW